MTGTATVVSILTRPEGRVLGAGAVDLVAVRLGVSILTRPEGRVLGDGHREVPGPRAVSILTRPEGRVLGYGIRVGGFRTLFLQPF